MHAHLLMLPTAVRILDVRQDNYRTRTFTLDLALDAVPGQFVMVWLPRFDEKPFSLVDANPVTLMVSAVGPFSTLLQTKRPGDRLWLRGPFGRGFRPVAEGGHAVLIGGGYGVAPLYWLAQTLAGRTPRVSTIVGARAAAESPVHGQFRGASCCGDRLSIARDHRGWLRRTARARDGCAGATSRRGRGVVNLRMRSPRHAFRDRGCGASGASALPTQLGGIHALRNRHLRRV